MSGARAGEEKLAASSLATVQQTGFALGAALAGLAANAAGLSAGLTRTDVAEAAFWVPMSFVLAGLAAVVAGVRLVRLRRRIVLCRERATPVAHLLSLTQPMSATGVARSRQ